MRMNCTKTPRLLLAALAVLSSQTAQAFNFTISNRQTGNATLLGLMNDLENSVNSTFGNGIEDNFIKSMAEAGRGATGSLGTDGPVRGSLFSISTSAGVSIATQGGFGSFEAGKNQLPGVGVGVQPSVTVGFNAKKLPKAATLGLDPTKVDYFFNFLSLNMSNLTPEAGFRLTNFGFTGRYWIKDSRSPIWAWRWDGLAISSGIQYSSMTARFQSNLDFTEGSGGSAVNWSPNADFGIAASNFTIPVDLRTGMTLLKFWTLSTGVGARFNFGSAKTEGAISGPVTNTGAGTIGTGTLDLNSTAQKPTTVSARFSIGNQFNFGPVKLFADAAYSTPKVADLALGLRFVW